MIGPQKIGGRAGPGLPDLARVTPGGILQVGEIKPAAIPCLVDGEEQLLRYIDQGNALDPDQVAWRAGEGIKVVAPMLSSAYSPPKMSVAVPGVGELTLETAWCTDGLLAYSVKKKEAPVKVPEPVPMPAPEGVKSPRRESQPTRPPELQPQPAPGMQPSPAMRTRLQQISEFVLGLIAAGILAGAEAERAIRNFLSAHPELIDTVIAAGVTIIVGTIIEDIATAGAGAVDDPATIGLATMLIRIARAIRMATVTP